MGPTRNGIISLALLTLSLVNVASCTVGHRFLPYNFTLAAVNVTLPNANQTGAPLVLGQDGASSGISFYVTSTYASFPYNDYPTLGLVNHTLRAYRQDGSWNTNATEVKSGGTLGWVTSTKYRQLAPDVYSAIREPDDEYALLAAHGFSNLWSLCPFPGNRPQTNVVFNISAADDTRSSASSPDPALCYPVRINIVPIV
ncbi:hypothetical protein M413DRAFT_68669 [Hebeloma cylindrosporum]|uniref:Cellobiose dehydrogenase cytochrome domain-containing protein n=1 Tax=Hebeloma cylindrosporum TaxID=76867 RepID=A0A0C2Y1W0_HEBCY|nr:hypothetical protein M413DRAFT_68669 [Hebeloma cylindrosporum h7]